MTARVGICTEGNLFSESFRVQIMNFDKSNPICLISILISLNPVLSTLHFLIVLLDGATSMVSSLHQIGNTEMRSRTVRYETI